MKSRRFLAIINMTMGDFESNEKFKIIVENCLDVIYIIDFNEKFLYITPSVKEVFGYKPEEVIGKNIVNFMMPQSYENQARLLRQDLKKNDPNISNTMIVNLFKKNGDKIWVEVRARFLLNKKGKPYAIMGIAREVSEEAAKEKKLV